MARAPGSHSLIASAALVAVLVPACDRDQGAADELLQRLEREDYRNSYTRAPGWGRRLRTEASPHGYWLDIYLNRAMSDAIDAGLPIDTWPEGSVVVAEAWATEDDEEREFLLAMTKPDSPAWMFSWDERGELVLAGEEAANCARCHDAGEDFIRAFTLPPIVNL